MPVSINISLLAHILLDSESSGRFGVQGNTFANTFTYLNEYFKTLPPDKYDEIKPLADSMNDLIKTEQKISDAASKNDLDNLVNHISEIAMRLPPNKKYLIPGGWQGVDPSGHAMIYEFENTNQGLCFSIYNSGAGINYHEKTSSTETELFSPVKKYLLPSTIDETELKQLIKRLIVPQLTPTHPARNMQEFDEAVLYTDIDFSLSFLKAKMLPQDLSQAHATTASQLSGTCAQRSIHQMLKIILGDLPKYQRLIFDFKMYALKNYLETHHPPRSKKLTQFIKKAIIHNLRILQKENIFPNSEEKKHAIEQLKTLQDDLKSTAETMESPFQKFLESSSTATSIFNYPFKLKTDVFKESNSELNQSQLAELKHITLNPDTLLDNLDEFIQECSLQQTSNPLWVMDQIDRLLLKLPIPESAQKDKPYYPTIDFYRCIKTAEDFEKIEKILDELQKLYVNACTSVLKNSTIPSQFLTEHSLFILRDYFDAKGEDVTGKPYFQWVSEIAEQLGHLQESPFIAMNHPAQDIRMKQIMNGFGKISLRRGLKTLDYSKFLERYPELFKTLNDEYEIKHGSDQSVFHQSLRKQKLSALYIFLSKLNDNYELKSSHQELKDNPDVQQVITLLVRQHALETFFIQGKNLLSGEREKVAPLKIGEDAYNYNAFIEKPDLSIGMGTIPEIKSITTHQYCLSTSPSLNALLQNHIAYPGNTLKETHYCLFRTYQDPDFGIMRRFRRVRLTSNQIQLVSHETEKSPQIIGQDDYFNRELFQIRLVPEQTIKLTLDYFSKTEYISRLNDPNIQLYVQANLFQSGWLCKALGDDPEFYVGFETFIEKGLSYFAESDKLLNPSLLFFIKLRVLTHNYEILMDIPHPEPDRLINDEVWLTKLIEQNHDADILTQLHTLRFLNAITQYQLGNIKLDLFSHALASWFYMQSKQIPHDTASAVFQQRAGLDFHTWLKTADPLAVKAEVGPIIRRLLTELSEAELDIQEKQYPIYEVIDKSTHQSYIFDAVQGKIFQNGQAVAPIPLDFINHPIMHQLGLERMSTCILHEDGQTISFRHPSHIRIKKDGHQFIVQKEWKVGQWYQLTALTDEQQIHFKLSKEKIKKNDLPATLTDSSTEAWVGASDTFIVQHGRPVYQIDRQGVFHVLDEKGNQTGHILVSQAPIVLSMISQFESREFYRVHLDENQYERGLIRFPRYDFSLAISGNSITIPDTNYTLVAPESSIFAPEIAALQFTNGTEQKCIVAVQAFYCNPDAGQTPGHYYQLTHDISGRIPHYKLKLEQIKNKITPPPLWNYQGSERTITYQLVNGKPMPETAADALYLCYLYLASHEVDKAWGILNDIPKRFALKGSMDEMTYLSWIVTALPVHLTIKENRSLNLSTPEYISCQLKALAIYTDYLTLNEQPVLSTDLKIDKSLKNGHCESIHLDNLKEFYAKLPDKIRLLYSRHQQGARHLDEAYTLSDDECVSLLNYCFPKSSDPDEKCLVPGSLGYAKCRLHLNQLLDEYRRLEAVCESMTQDGRLLPTAFTQRLDEIKQQITEEQRIAKIRTQLEKISVDLSLRGSLDTKLLSKRAISEIESWGYEGINAITDPKDAMNKLNSGILPDDFIIHFPTFVNIARVGPVEQKNQLNRFCLAYLAGVGQGKPDERRTNICFLTNILYRILNNPDKLPEETSDEPLTLSKLIQVVSSFEIPPIEVLQAKDVYEGILTDTQTIWKELELTIPLQSPMPALRPIYTKSLVHLLGVETYCKPYFQEEIKYRLAIDGLQQSIQDTIDPVILREAEEKAGQLKYDCIQAQRCIAEERLKAIDIRMALKKSAQKLHDKQTSNLNSSWDKVITTANQVIKTPSSSQHAEWLAAKRHLLTQKELLSLYLHADSALYMEKTGLSFAECVRLHQLIHKSISLEIQCQQTKRLLSALEKAELSDIPQASDLHHIAAVLIGENVHQTQTDPGLMLFQYAENILINPRQADVIQSLLSSSDDPLHVKNVVEKVIMGGGKSKVILPLLAAKKVTELNFVLVEVPRSLLATNHADLNNTSQRLFGQKAIRFEFSRDSNCSPERLQSIYQTFSGIMTNRDYLVTTGESMQSLELKCMELLLEKPADPKDLRQWEKQVYWANKIVTLIKERGDVVIDEVHQGLQLKKKLNYTIGYSQPIDKKLIQHAILLYQFTNQLKHVPTVDDLLLHENSPLKDCLYALNPLGDPEKEQDIRKQLQDWFNNLSMPALFDEVTSDIQDTLAFYKEQLTLLPQTQSRHYKEHYGPSQTQETVLKQALAIPYTASNRPSERSRFGNTLETLNYTIQSLFAEGLSEALLKESILKWQADARSEHLSGQYATLDDTPTGQRINFLLNDSGFTLQKINLQEAKHLTKLGEKLKNAPTLLYTILEEHILPQVSIEPELLHSDAYAHVDMYRSVQGISGTPWNHTTYHQRLICNLKASLGSDGFIQTVLKRNSTSVTQCKFEKSDLFLKNILADKHNVRAIIDICAAFAGVSNLDIAKQIASCAKDQNIPKPIRYILYFNQEDILCALDVANHDKPIILGISDPVKIDEMLGCTPEERITFYDQSHTVGTDIKQGSTAHALVLADNKTHLQSFLQGCMRMRGLAEQQTMSVIIPDNQCTSFDDFIELMAKNELEQLKQDNFFAAIAKMKNVIRHDLLHRILAIPEKDYEVKYQMMQRFRTYFVDTKSSILFEQYGGVYELQDTEKLLQEVATRLLNDWETFVLDSSDKEMIKTTLAAIVTQSVPVCHSKSRRCIHDMDQETEEQQEKLQEMLSEKEMMLQAESFSSSLNPAKPCSEEILLSSLKSFLKTGIATTMQSLNSACGFGCNHFSEQLLVHDNYAQVFVGQNKMLSPYVKPALAILFRKNGENITACLIDVEDLALFQKEISTQEQEPLVWIGTTQHTCLAGKMPDNLQENSQYQSLIEQVRLFNGECVTLSEQISEQKTPPKWLNHEKMTWFDEHIRPYRQTKISEFNRLHMTLSSINASVIKIDSKTRSKQSPSQRFFQKSDSIPSSSPSSFANKK